MSTFSFSKVVIIQALDQGDDESGTKLGQFIDSLRSFHQNIPRVELINLQCRQEFLDVIDRLTREAEQSDECPILQIEMHGWDDKSGLAFPDESSLLWHELATPFAKLNKATGFNLLVCMSACFGGRSLSFVKPDSPSPCFALIGPTESIFPDELLASFKSLYRELLTTLDANAALAKLHATKLQKGGFITVTAEDWFFRLADGYLRTYCTKERLATRGAAIIEKLRSEGTELNATQLSAFAQIGQKMAYSFVDRQFPRFFMLEDTPGNRSRFDASLSAAKLRINEFMASQK